MSNLSDFMPGTGGMRNRIMNGKMDIAQRGTSFAAIADSAYSLDRYKTEYTTSAVTTVSQQADVPSSNEFQNSLRVAVTTADASIAAGDLYVTTQSIEGYNVRDLIGRTFTLSFWVRSSKTGTHCVAFVNDGSNRSYIAEYTISAANTWEFKKVTVSGGLITAGTWDWTSGRGLKVRFALAAGSTYQTTANAWQTGNFAATSAQVNCLDTIGNIFAITGVQLEPGAVATPFEQRPYGMELALCQRYALVIPPDVFFGTGTNRTGGVDQYIHIPTPSTMRTAPTFTYTTLTLYCGDLTTTATITGAQSSTTNGIWVRTTSAAIGSTQNAVAIYTTTGNCVISAEL